MQMRHLSWLGLLLLTACSSYAPPANLTAVDRETLLARMGPPDTERQTATGSRLEFPRGPMGHHTWFVYLDTAGRATRTEQVLTEPNFNEIMPGMTQDEVRQRLGRPSETQGLARSRGVVWSYRYENPFCQWFQVEMSQEQTVRSVGYGEPPECQKRDDVFIP
ncbi:MAG: outer membrane protein assembly factor BamE [Rhodoferax sp.]|nr:outer membrane protein assembly factor BamE [Rhodoferax sp.]